MTNQYNDQQQLQEINKEIYRRNVQLAVVNKTLSLLRKLYQISLQSLEPEQLALKISNTIRQDLNMEMVGILILDQKTNKLKPYKFSFSARLSSVMQQEEKPLDTLVLSAGPRNILLHSVLYNHRATLARQATEIWGDKLAKSIQDKLVEVGHLQTFFLFPLITQDAVMGVLLMGLNRNYNDLNDFEKESLKSCVDVVSVALDKNMLYEKLASANSKLKALDKARAEFITIASHQLRTPPATIKWYLAAILDGDFGPIDDELRKALERVQVTNDSQISTISDLLNASRIERGKLEFFFEKADINKMVDSIVMQLRPLAEMKKLKLLYTPPKKPVPELIMDQEKVRQVMNNIIDNAIKYSEAGSITVNLKSTKNEVTFSVKDEGNGMDEKTQLSLFEKFSRGDQGATHATGLGLGMYVAKVIINQHNGDIWAKSEGLGKGSEFGFSIPLHSKLKATTVNLAKS